MGINTLFDLEGKTAVVTGGTSHLGRAICESLMGAGADVAVAGRDLEACRKLAKELSAEYNSTAAAVKIDISSVSSVNKCIEDVYKIFKRVDILVNNACFGAAGGIEQLTEAKWKKGIDGTINGVFRCTQAVTPYMRKQKGGVIINIASMYGVISPDPGIYGDSGFNNPPNYGAGKAAVIQFTKYGACHLADKNIRINSITPGAFPSEKVQKNKKFVNNLKKKIPLGRIGRPDELKGAVLFLASDASSYVTGTNIIVDGGWTAW
ncbi:MAG: SDR family oxidoreductase [Candidatus Omnitrophota bacterium]|nr:SDR family oxidoreductase [Candidatus Omnitrophota bacterium]